MVLEIKELQKPEGVWCDHCSTRRSCDIYEQRPKECRDFYCGYLTIGDLGEEWKPSKSKIVLVSELDGNRICAYVHPNRPDAWRREPFYSTLKEWAVAAAAHRGQVMVCIGRRTYMILPDRDVDLGIVGDDERIVTGEKQTPFGIQLEAFTVHKDDPLGQLAKPPGFKPSSGKAPEDMSAEELDAELAKVRAELEQDEAEQGDH